MTITMDDNTRSALTALTIVLYLVATVEMGLAAYRAYQAGHVWGDHPASWSWVWGIALLTVSLLTLFFASQRFVELPLAYRLAGFFVAMGEFVGGAVLLGRGFAILRDAGYMWRKRRQSLGIHHGTSAAELLQERTEQLAEANVRLVTLEERVRIYEGNL